MWLINTETLELEMFNGSKNTPPYAILSHTWGKDKDEVTLKDLMQGVRKYPAQIKFKERLQGVKASPAPAKEGFKKIKMTCHLARTKHQLKYAWVDTCCIDKSSSAELSEAINSMFNWYQRAKVCFVFLADLQSKSQNFKDCQWFTRGWTLQELLAPRDIEFYDADWLFRGSKQALKAEISMSSRIDIDVLTGTRSLADIPIAVRMSWASTRETSREEDEAYCLLGIFDVNMPLLYGEGRKAFVRLQEEIIKRSADMSIFAWMALEDNPPSFSGLLARSPVDFRHSGIAVLCNYEHFDIAPFSINNRGVCLNLALYRKSTTGLHIMPVNCKLGGEKAPRFDPHSSGNGPHAICLRQVGQYDFVRASPDRLVIAIPNNYETSFRVATQVSASQALLIHQQITFIRSPRDLMGDFYLNPYNVRPAGCYDPSQSLIFAGHTGTFLGYFHFEPTWKADFDSFYFIFRFDRSRTEAPWRYALLSSCHWTHHQPYRAAYASYSSRFFVPGQEMSLRLLNVNDESIVKRVVLTIVPPEASDSNAPWSQTIEFAVVDEKLMCKSLVLAVDQLAIGSHNTEFKS